MKGFEERTQCLLIFAQANLRLERSGMSNKLFILNAKNVHTNKPQIFQSNKSNPIKSNNLLFLINARNVSK